MGAAPDMIERVARAMHAEFNSSGRGDYTHEWEDPLASRDYFLAQARAALEEMREPTEAMVEDADTSAYPVTGEFAPMRFRNIYRMWSAMIDAALGREAASPADRSAMPREAK